MKITKDKLIQIIKEEAMALMESGIPLPKKKDPEEEGREAKMKFADRWSKFHKAKEAPSELDRILGPDSDQELDPETLAWIDDLIKKLDDIE